MRRVINISLPNQLALAVDKAVSDRNYASKSEFIRLLIRNWMEESGIIEELKQSRKELKMGKGKLLKSLKDLR